MYSMLLETACLQGSSPQLYSGVQHPCWGGSLTFIMTEPPVLAPPPPNYTSVPRGPGWRLITPSVQQSRPSLVSNYSHLFYIWKCFIQEPIEAFFLITLICASFLHFSLQFIVYMTLIYWWIFILMWCKPGLMHKHAPA